MPRQSLYKVDITSTPSNFSVIPEENINFCLMNVKVVQNLDRNLFCGFSEKLLDTFSILYVVQDSSFSECSMSPNLFGSFLIEITLATY